MSVARAAMGAVLERVWRVFKWRQYPRQLTRSLQCTDQVLGTANVELKRCYAFVHMALIGGLRS